MSRELRSQLNRIQWITGGAGVAAFSACIAGAFFSRRQFFFSYLFGYLFWLGLALGCMGVTMLHHLTGGRWGFPIRRFLEASCSTLPVLAILFLPILFGIGDLYPWAHPDVVAAHDALRAKLGYLNLYGFIFRAVVIFAVWICLGWLLKRWSVEQDRTQTANPTWLLLTLSGPGL